MDVSSAPDMQDLIEWVKKNRSYKKKPGLTKEGKKFIKLLSKSKQKDGSATRFWGIQAPEEKKKRKAMLARCPGCFLDDDPADPKYPICSEFVFDTERNKCQVDCRGVAAARSRAKNNDPKIHELAMKVQKMKCTR